MEKYDLLKWKEFGTPDAPSIRILFCPSKYPKQDVIADYLDNEGTTGLVSPSYAQDKISGDLITPHKIDCIKSNSAFSWDGSLAYYVRKYNLRLPAEYESYILQHTL